MREWAKNECGNMAGFAHGEQESASRSRPHIPHQSRKLFEVNALQQNPSLGTYRAYGALMHSGAGDVPHRFNPNRPNSKQQQNYKP